MNATIPDEWALLCSKKYSYIDVYLFILERLLGKKNEYMKIYIEINFSALTVHR